MDDFSWFGFRRCGNVCRNDLATFITGVVSTFFSAYFYDVKLNTCFAVFYEELDYADKNSVEL